MLAHPSLPVLGEILLGILVAIAAIFDIRYRRIPNWLTLAGIVVGFAWNGLAFGAPGLGRAAAGMGLGLLLYFPLYLLRARGAGDVKLLAAAGAIIGPGNCFWLFLLTAILGGLIAVLLLMFRGRMRRTFFNMGFIVHDLARLRAPYRSSEELDVTTTKGMRLPHGALMAAGVIALIAIARSGWTI
ncbi:MAG TPA: A24 family peptidase [Bryobacteraceae bacterium]|nr:A24 family peptidase [Bryobacteraceae bacterium]